MAGHQCCDTAGNPELAAPARNLRRDRPAVRRANSCSTGNIRERGKPRLIAEALDFVRNGAFRKNGTDRPSAFGARPFQSVKRQISSAYPRIVRSDEKDPMRIVVMTLARHHRSGSPHNASTAR